MVPGNTCKKINCLKMDDDENTSLSSLTGIMVASCLIVDLLLKLYSECNRGLVE